MDMKNCRKCGKLFNYVSGPPICPKCREKVEEKFQEVKKYVQENRSATYGEIEQNCDVERKQIEQWVREERLVFAEDSPIKLSCELCGKTILTGRYCDACKKNTANTISAAGRQPEAPKPLSSDRQKNPTRMHTFHG
jgi:flagellar operon protein (TIGR03826 family)